MQIDELKKELRTQIATHDHPPEMAVDVMSALQTHYGYLSDAVLDEAADLLGMTALELDELATFYTFLYREPVGRYVIHVCDSLVCWMEAGEDLAAHLQKTLGIEMGATTADGLFTLLPVCCIGYCDRAPAILINKKVYGPLTLADLDALLDQLRSKAEM